MDRQGQRVGKMELLAPAGGMEAFKAAIENGADAVYLGGKSFNARASAANFDLEEMRQAVKYAQERLVKVYVTVNIIIADQEFPELLDYLYALHEIGVDAVILQDIGVADTLQALLPEMEIHASTQMTVNTSWGVQHLESMGFKRVVLGRETAAEEMRTIAQQTPLELEVFVHGALCICYSGQCLMSSLIGGRSGNRGECAQPCRMTYQLVDEQREDALAGTEIGEHLLSPRDLNLIKELGTLKEIGIDSLKIEGRMKRPEYTATVTRVYRDVLNRVNAQEQGDITGQIILPEEQQDLAQIFNRDFTQAYFGEHPGAELMSYNRPNNRGTRLGRVANIDGTRLSIKLEAPLSVGDGIEVWTRKGNEGISVGPIWRAKEKIEEGKPGETVQIEFSGYASQGDRVFKTHDAKLMEKARLTFQEGKEQRKRPLKMRLSGTLGAKLKLEAWDDSRYAETYSQNVAQVAIKRPLTQDYAWNQLGRLGTTPYSLVELEFVISDEIMVPVSDLNEMRRQVVEKLLAELHRQPKVSVGSYRKRVEARRQDLSTLRSSLKNQAKPVLAVAVSDLESLYAAVSGGAQRILLGGEHWRSRKGFTLEDLKKGLEFCQNKGVEAVWRLPRILNQEQSTLVLRQLAKAAKWKNRPVVMVGNIGELEMLFFLDPNWPFEIDYSLNVFNEATYAYFARKGVKRITLSPELHHEQVRALAKWPLTEMLVFGDLEMMVSEYCPIGATLGGKKGEFCSKPCHNEPYFLKDRLNYDFPIETDMECRMHLFNSKRLNLIAELPQIAKFGVSSVRLQLTRTAPQQVREVVSLFKQAWDTGHARKKDKSAEEDMDALAKLFPEGFTKGHFFRGILN